MNTELEEFFKTITATKAEVIYLYTKGFGLSKKEAEKRFTEEDKIAKMFINKGVKL